MRLMVLFFVICSSTYGQMVEAIVNGRSTQGPIIPKVATLHAGSSSGTNAVGAQTNTTCAANKYCISLPSASASGDTIAVFYTYTSTNTTAHAPTVSDDKSDTYTCATEGNDASGTTRAFAGVCYSINVASGARAIGVLMPVATTTHVQAVAVELYNVVTGDTLTATNGTQTASTTYTSGTLNTTVDGDMICDMVAGTTTRRNLGTSFTAGSGFTLRSADRLDGFAVQCGVQTTHGSITPTMTGLSNTYVSLDISFKAGASGSAPSGMYILSELHQSTDTGSSTTSWTIQDPSNGANLLASSNVCGGSGPMQVTAISDGTNTWKASSPTINLGSSSGLNNLFYAENATGSATLSLTITTSGTGDCSFQLYNIAGAATAAFMSHIDDCAASPANLATCTASAAPTATANYSPFTLTGTFNPGSLSGIVIGNLNQGQNTTVGTTSPSAAVLDSDTTGGEPIDGPWPVDENNGWGNFVNTDNSAETWTYTQSLSSRSVSASIGTLDSFAASGATLKPVNVLSTNCVASTSGTSLTCTITPHRTGNMIAILAATGVTSGNITVTDGAANTIVKCSGATCGGSTDACVTITSIGCLKLFYITSVNTTSSDTFTFTFPTTTYRSVWLHELANVTTFDLSSIGTQTSSGGFVTSPSITTTGTDEIILGWTVASGTSSVDTSASGGTLGRYDGAGTGLGQLSQWRVLTTSGAKTMRFVSSGGNDGVGIVGFK